MDLLDNYKKAWDNQPEEASQFSAIEIYKLAQSRSSSIVKWIFIIGILEFVILNAIYLFVDMEEASKEYKKIGLENFIYYSQFLAYIIIFYFLIQFYLNYRRISAIESTKVLMKKILKTRKTVRNYVIFNLGYVAVLMIIVAIANIKINFKDLATQQICMILGATILVTILLLGVLWVFYQLLYGFLLKKLKRNYKELAKLDSAN